MTFLLLKWKLQKTGKIKKSEEISSKVFFFFREGFFQFLIRLCASVGGLVATSTIVCGLVKNFISFVCCLNVPSTPTKSQLNTAKPETVNMLAAVDLTVPKNKIQPPQKAEVKSS